MSALERAGYQYRGERGLPGREYFAGASLATYHLHLVEDGSALLVATTSPFATICGLTAEAAREFARLKRVLAARFAHDREGYMNAKGSARPGHPAAGAVDGVS